jgi:hypothetical protein
VFGSEEGLPEGYVASLLELIDRSYNSKRRIHYLSFVTGSDMSINDCIKPEYSSLVYSTVEQIFELVVELGEGCTMVKRDLKDGFRHMPVSPLDLPLLGFRWRGKYYSELFLPFGLCTSPYLFNYFAEAFHWILDKNYSCYIRLQKSVVLNSRTGP